MKLQILRKEWQAIPVHKFQLMRYVQLIHLWGWIPFVYKFLAMLGQELLQGNKLFFLASTSSNVIIRVTSAQLFSVTPFSLISQAAHHSYILSALPGSWPVMSWLLASLSESLLPSLTNVPVQPCLTLHWFQYVTQFSLLSDTIITIELQG